MDEFRDRIKVLKTLADENRLRIAMMLKIRPLCVCEINAMLDIALSTISSHLKMMRSNGIINDDKQGRWITYSLTEDPYTLSLIAVCLQGLEGVEPFTGDSERLKDLCREICALQLHDKSNNQKL
jgi:ArsR family transcriptional regulator